MITIAGGTYLEICVEPVWDQLFGSGARAAAALSILSDRVNLATYVADRDRDTLEVLASTFGFHLQTTVIPSTILFSYDHGLSVPRIRPATHLIAKALALTVRDTHILRFGFIEGDAVVHGETVVYDPQSAYDPRSFRDNGSTAGRLAIVANQQECASLAKGKWTEGATIAELGKAVLQEEGAEVVVVKCGCLGATVVTANGDRSIPAFPTLKVWPIGSGDVFAAVFAHYWGAMNGDPYYAAELASLSAAYYCQTKCLPIPADLPQAFSPLPLASERSNFPATSNSIYLAGPFFTMAQRWMIDESRKCLSEQGFNVFSPLHDVGYGAAPEVVSADIKALSGCDIVFALLDGLDSGTLFEIGYARAIDKPVIAFVQNETENSLKMLEGTECQIVDDFVSAIYRVTWRAMSL